MLLVQAERQPEHRDGDDPAAQAEEAAEHAEHAAQREKEREMEDVRH